MPRGFLNAKWSRKSYGCLLMSIAVTEKKLQFHAGFYFCTLFKEMHQSHRKSRKFLSMQHTQLLRGDMGLYNNTLTTSSKRNRRG